MKLTGDVWQVKCDMGATLCLWTTIWAYCEIYLACLLCFEVFYGSLKCTISELLGISR